MTVLAALVWAALSQPNVILISADTLRADHLGCYGYSFPVSPNIDRLAAEGLLFEDMSCEVPLTSPSFVSMMTSLPPRMTGATRNGLALPADVPTVAEQFRAAGYETVAVLSNWTLKAHLSGLGRGFDVYEDRFHKRRWGIVKAERDGDEVARIALELLAARDPSRPLFAWFHFSDPHAPYNVHRDFNPSKALATSSARGAKKSLRYDSEIAYMDYWIGKLMDALPKENTFIVFVADHGESLWEHDYLGHGRRIYQTCLHIPFAVRGPGIEPGRSRIPARGVDVGPTLLGLAGIARLEGMQGADLLRDAVAADRVRVVETYGGAVPKLPGAKNMMADAGPQRQGVAVEGWKLILDGPRAELYRLADDPMETRNLAAEHPGKVAELRALIAEWDEATPRRVAGKENLSGDDKDALESLGYIK